MGFVRTRVLSFAMVGGVVFLLLVSRDVETFSEDDYLKKTMTAWRSYPGTMVFFCYSIPSVIALLFVLIFRYLPDAKSEERRPNGSALTAVFLCG